MLKTSHLFSPLSDEVSNVTAFLDRIHFYLPGWEMIKFAPKHFTSSFGFSTDYFSEALKSFADLLIQMHWKNTIRLDRISNKEIPSQ